ncbi:hypothetical protein FQN60_004291 [Etheostoma spectabile]|uniref:Uncharacterized protein n=1 Tax=Etheostoma spectabile TaxID=54343 RepID=A0A5J5CV27_9PERO|nr:hypothetical protein FQN60_004291 [Etheostoma spectabile]
MTAERKPPTGNPVSFSHTGHSEEEKPAAGSSRYNRDSNQSRDTLSCVFAQRNRDTVNRHTGTSRTGKGDQLDRHTVTSRTGTGDQLDRHTVTSRTGTGDQLERHTVTSRTATGEQKDRHRGPEGPPQGTRRTGTGEQKDPHR